MAPPLQIYNFIGMVVMLEVVPRKHPHIRYSMFFFHSISFLWCTDSWQSFLATTDPRQPVKLHAMASTLAVGGGGAGWPGPPLSVLPVKGGGGGGEREEGTSWPSLPRLKPGSRASPQPLSHSLSCRQGYGSGSRKGKIWGKKLKMQGKLQKL